MFRLCRRPLCERQLCTTGSNYNGIVGSEIPFKHLVCDIGIGNRRNYLRHTQLSLIMAVAQHPITNLTVTQRENLQLLIKKRLNETSIYSDNVLPVRALLLFRLAETFSLTCLPKLSGIYYGYAFKQKASRAGNSRFRSLLGA